MKYGRMVQISVILMTIIMFTSCQTRERVYTIYDSESGRELSLRHLAELLKDYDVILFGEYHGNEVIHQIQAGILPYLYQRNSRLAISMEMFERDVQEYMDLYLDNSISEDDFLANTRPWPNYKTDYRPLVEFARTNDLSVLASNIPRRYANMVSRSGLDAIEDIPAEERHFVARDLLVTDDEYRENFYATMLSISHMMSTSEEELEERLFNFYAAQSIKDDTMAESIVDFIRDNPQSQVIHFTGDFHIRERLGIYTKISEFNPDLEIVTISPLIISGDEKFTFHEDLRNIADYVIVLRQTEDITGVENE